MTKIITFISLLIGSVFSTFAHPIYITITDVHYNSDKKVFEVTIKAFQDDALRAIQELAEVKEPCPDDDKLAEETFEKYISRHFLLELDGKVLKQEFVGIKCEDDDVVYLFVKFRAKGNWKELEIKNDFFFNIIPEQENVIHFKNGDYKKSGLLNTARPRMTFRPE